MLSVGVFQYFVNNKEQKVVTDPQRILLEVLREDLKLTGTNFGCKEGLCGACTILIEGEPNHSCMVTIGEAENKWITTIEGLADGDKLHPAFEEQGGDVALGLCFDLHGSTSIPPSR